MPAVRYLRFALLAIALVTLLAALWAGLLRLGWHIPSLTANLAAIHGPLMVSGFLGTVIGLERAVALGYRWAYLAPLLSAAGSVLLLGGLPPPAGGLLFCLSSFVLIVIFGVILKRQSALFTVTSALGAVAWLLGNLLWLSGAALSRVAPWWMGFLVLTIAGERLELSRLLQLTRWSRALFLVLTVAMLAGLVLGLFDPFNGSRLFGIGLFGLALWLLNYDLARHTARQRGLARFIGLALLSGYVWLAISGLLHLGYGAVAGGPAYDAVLHTVFLGFAFVLIFAHAPIIIPAVTGRSIPYRPGFYSHLALLHVSLLLRLGGGLAGSAVAWQWGGLLNAVAVLLFLVNTARAARAGTREASLRDRASAGTSDLPRR
ncbi:MAG TPA: hypothetical protein VFB73_05880 [Chloroflexota bacterium]|nr:hypothetical protein [Chloroflexota bacterium]